MVVGGAEGELVGGDIGEPVGLISVGECEGTEVGNVVGSTVGPELGEAVGT